LEYEKKGWPFLLIAGIFIAAMLTRFFASAISPSYIPYLGYAAAIWIVGAVAWGVIFVPRIFKA
jgi:hypothetical protein